MQPLIKPDEIKVNFNYLKYVLPMRRRYQAAGLTVFGQPRRRSAIAKPPGLSRREWNTICQRSYRAKRKAEAAQ